MTSATQNNSHSSRRKQQRPELWQKKMAESIEKSEQMRRLSMQKRKMSATASTRRIFLVKMNWLYIAVYVAVCIVASNMQDADQNSGTGSTGSFGNYAVMAQAITFQNTPHSFQRQYPETEYKPKSCYINYDSRGVPDSLLGSSNHTAITGHNQYQDSIHRYNSGIELLSIKVKIYLTVNLTGCGVSNGNVSCEDHYTIRDSPNWNSGQTRFAVSKFVQNQAGGWPAGITDDMRFVTFQVKSEPKWTLHNFVLEPWIEYDIGLEAQSHPSTGQSSIKWWINNSLVLEESWNSTDIKVMKIHPQGHLGAYRRSSDNTVSKYFPGVISGFRLWPGHYNDTVLYEDTVRNGETTDYRCCDNASYIGGSWGWAGENCVLVSTTTSTTSTSSSSSTTSSSVTTTEEITTSSSTTAFEKPTSTTTNSALAVSTAVVTVFASSSTSTTEGEKTSTASPIPIYLATGTTTAAAIVESKTTSPSEVSMTIVTSTSATPNENFTSENYNVTLGVKGSDLIVLKDKDHNVNVGDHVIGEGIEAGTTVVSINGNQLTLSNSNTADVTKVRVKRKLWVTGDKGKDYVVLVDPSDWVFVREGDWAIGPVGIGEVGKAVADSTPAEILDVDENTGIIRLSRKNTGDVDGVLKTERPPLKIYDRPATEATTEEPKATLVAGETTKELAAANKEMVKDVLPAPSVELTEEEQQQQQEVEVAGTVSTVVFVGAFGSIIANYAMVLVGVLLNMYKRYRETVKAERRKKAKLEQKMKRQNRRASRASISGDASMLAAMGIDGRVSGTFEPLTGGNLTDTEGDLVKNGSPVRNVLSEGRHRTDDLTAENLTPASVTTSAVKKVPSVKSLAKSPSASKSVNALNTIRRPESKQSFPVASTNRRASLFSMKSGLDPANPNSRRRSSVFGMLPTLSVLNLGTGDNDDNDDASSTDSEAEREKNRKRLCLPETQHLWKVIGILLVIIGAQVIIFLHFPKIYALFVNGILTRLITFAIVIFTVTLWNFLVSKRCLAHEKSPAKNFIESVAHFFKVKHPNVLKVFLVLLMLVCFAGFLLYYIDDIWFVGAACCACLIGVVDMMMIIPLCKAMFEFLRRGSKKKNQGKENETNPPENDKNMSVLPMQSDVDYPMAAKHSTLSEVESNSDLDRAGARLRKNQSMQYNKSTANLGDIDLSSNINARARPSSFKRSQSHLMNQQGDVQGDYRRSSLIVDAGQQQQQVHGQGNATTLTFGVANKMSATVATTAAGTTGNSTAGQFNERAAVPGKMNSLSRSGTGVVSPSMAQREMVQQISVNSRESLDSKSFSVPRKISAGAPGSGAAMTLMALNMGITNDTKSRNGGGRTFGKIELAQNEDAQDAKRMRNSAVLSNAAGGHLSRPGGPGAARGAGVVADLGISDDDEDILASGRSRYNDSSVRRGSKESVPSLGSKSFGKSKTFDTRSPLASGAVVRMASMASVKDHGPQPWRKSLSKESQHQLSRGMSTALESPKFGKRLEDPSVGTHSKQSSVFMSKQLSSNSNTVIGRQESGSMSPKSMRSRGLRDEQRDNTAAASARSETQPEAPTKLFSKRGSRVIELGRDASAPDSPGAASRKSGFGKSLTAAGLSTLNLEQNSTPTAATKSGVLTPSTAGGNQVGQLSTMSGITQSSQATGTPTSSTPYGQQQKMMGLVGNVENVDSVTARATPRSEGTVASRNHGAPRLSLDYSTSPSIPNKYRRASTGLVGAGGGGLHASNKKFARQESILLVESHDTSPTAIGTLPTFSRSRTSQPGLMAETNDYINSPRSATGAAVGTMGLMGLAIGKYASSGGNHDNSSVGANGSPQSPLSQQAPTSPMESRKSIGKNGTNRRSVLEDPVAKLESKDRSSRRMSRSVSGVHGGQEVFAPSNWGRKASTTTAPTFNENNASNTIDGVTSPKSIQSVRGNSSKDFSRMSMSVGKTSTLKL